MGKYVSKLIHNKASDNMAKGPILSNPEQNGEPSD